MANPNSIATAIIDVAVDNSKINKEFAKTKTALNKNAQQISQNFRTNFEQISTKAIETTRKISENFQRAFTGMTLAGGFAVKKFLDSAGGENALRSWRATRKELDASLARLGKMVWESKIFGKTIEDWVKSLTKFLDKLNQGDIKRFVKVFEKIAIGFASFKVAIPIMDLVKAIGELSFVLAAARQNAVGAGDVVSAAGGISAFKGGAASAAAAVSMSKRITSKVPWKPYIRPVHDMSEFGGGTISSGGIFSLKGIRSRKADVDIQKVKAMFMADKAAEDTHNLSKYRPTYNPYAGKTPIPPRVPFDGKKVGAAISGSMVTKVGLVAVIVASIAGTLSGIVSKFDSLKSMAPNVKDGMSALKTIFDLILGGLKLAFGWVFRLAELQTKLTIDLAMMLNPKNWGTNFERMKKDIKAFTEGDQNDYWDAFKPDVDLEDPNKNKKDPPDPDSAAIVADFKKQYEAINAPIKAFIDKLIVEKNKLVSNLSTTKDLEGIAILEKNIETLKTKLSNITKTSSRWMEDFRNKISKALSGKNGDLLAKSKVFKDFMENLASDALNESRGIEDLSDSIEELGKNAGKAGDRFDLINRMGKEQVESSEALYEVKTKFFEGLASIKEKMAAGLGYSGQTVGFSQGANFASQVGMDWQNKLLEIEKEKRDLAKTNLEETAKIQRNTQTMAEGFARALEFMRTNGLDAGTAEGIAF